MNHIKKFNESILGDDTLNIQITRSEYKLLGLILDMLKGGLMDRGSWRTNLQDSGDISEKYSDEIKKYLLREGTEEVKRYLYDSGVKKVTDMNYLDYIMIRLEKEFEENNI